MTFSTKQMELIIAALNEYELSIYGKDDELQNIIIDTKRQLANELAKESK